MISFIWHAGRAKPIGTGDRSMIAVGRERGWPHRDTWNVPGGCPHCSASWWRSACVTICICKAQRIAHHAEKVLPVCVWSSFIRVQLCATLWTVACQIPVSKGFSRQGYWSGLPFAPPGDLPDSGIKLGSPALQVDSLPSEPSGKPGEAG